MTDVLLGDNNTRYFQMVANGKHRKKRIFSLEHEGGKIEGQYNLKGYITQFYKELFGPPEENNFTLGDRTDDIPQVSSLENAFLVAPFTEKEIRDAIFDMDHNKAPGPDASQLNSISSFGTSLKGTSCKCSMICIKVIFLSSV